MATLDGCRCRGAAGRSISTSSSSTTASSSSSSSILYSILKSESLQEQQQQQQQQPPQQLQLLLHKASPAPQQQQQQQQQQQLQLQQSQACSCGSTRRRGVLRSPQVTCKAASAVLVKTLRFVKNVPCFRELPDEDQLLLIRSGWAPLLVLGLAQDRVDFDTSETVEPSMLQRILTGAQDSGRQGGEPAAQSRGSAAAVTAAVTTAAAASVSGVSVVDIEAIKAFLKKCWSVDISTKEYAYLKGAVLFNPDVEGLCCLHYIQSLRREAHQALNEHVRLIHREDSTRFAKLLIALSMLRAISPGVVAQLFFRPVIGMVNIEEVLMEMFYGK